MEHRESHNYHDDDDNYNDNNKDSGREKNIQLIGRNDPNGIQFNDNKRYKDHITTSDR